MKRPFIILLAGAIGIALILFFRPKSPVVNVSAIQSTPTDTVPVVAIKNAPTEITTQTPPIVVASTQPPKLLDATKAQTIADWTNAVPNLKVWNHFRNENSWLAEQRNPTNAPTLLLTGANGDPIQYKTKLTDIETVGDHIRRVELQSVWMDIADTRSLGDSLLQMMGEDKIGFDEWCAKVGNNWVDAPLYDSPDSQVPNSNKFYGFQMLRSYNNEKPWVIYFIISDK